MYFPYILNFFISRISSISFTGVTWHGLKWNKKTFCSRLRYHSTNFLKVENLRFTWTGYGDDVIGHFRKKSIIFRDMRTQWERDAKVRFRISLPSFEKIDSQIPELKKNWPYPIQNRFSNREVKFCTKIIPISYREGPFSVWLPSRFPKYDAV